MKIFDPTILQDNAQPDIIDEVSDDLTYLGFLDHGSLQKALIIKVEKVGNVTTRTFPDGQLNYDRDFDLRDTYNYSFKK